MSHNRIEQKKQKENTDLLFYLENLKKRFVFLYADLYTNLNYKTHHTCV